MFRFHFSYELPISDGFMRGENIILDKDDPVKALKQMQAKHPDANIAGYLKSLV
jgi:hypothetical protein